MARNRLTFDLEKVEALAARGLTHQQIAHNLGISHDTLYKRKRTSAEFSDAIERGKAKGITQVANKLFESAVGGHFQAQKYFLTCRGGEEWQENRMQDNLQAQQPVINITMPKDGD